MFHFSCALRRITYSVQRTMSSVAKPIVIFVLGGPGAGKGTQCEKIVKVNTSRKIISSLPHSNKVQIVVM